MASFLEDIDTVIHQDFRSSKKRMEECQASMRIDVDHTGCLSSFYSFDKALGKEYKGGLFPFFAPVKGANKVCDFIVFAERANRNYILLIELKKGNSQTFPQLKAANDFINYVIATVNRVCDKVYRPTIRLISIHDIDLPKRPTAPTGIIYDDNNHHIVKSRRFVLKHYLV